MQIAVIGWGSLIWCPGCLRIKSRWSADGPALPIEFARISNDKRLTLVIHSGSPDQRTYWALSEFHDLKAARKNLQAREDTSSKHIQSLTACGLEEGVVDPKISARIRDWLKGRKDVQAAVWTALPSNWKDQRGHHFKPEDALQYVIELEQARGETKATYDRTREYVINAPIQIQTAVRKKLRETKGWKDAPLSAILFAKAKPKSRS